MNKETCRNILKNQNSYVLRHIRKTLEIELLAAVQIGDKFTQAHIGKLEMAQAAGEELYSRDGNELIDPVPYIETNLENGKRFGFSMRVF